MLVNSIKRCEVMTETCSWFSLVDMTIMKSKGSRGTMLHCCWGARCPDVLVSGKELDRHCHSGKTWSRWPVLSFRNYFCEVTFIPVPISSVNIFSPFLKAKQRAEVLQSTQRFFSEQQQSKPIGGKAQKVDENGSKPSEAIADSSGVCQDKAEEKPAPAPPAATKPVRTGPIKPQAIKTEETKS